jgi:hypothetical protein
MKQRFSIRAAARAGLWSFAAAVLAVLSAEAAEPQVRLSFKFILNSSGNRPATGNINTDAEINEQVTRGNEIFADHISEFRFQNVEILNVSGQSSYYLNDASESSRDAIRSAALADPGAFFWRNNAINVYITGASDSAISKFPPDNDIIILCQGIFDTTLAHEVGHSLNLLHTHQGGGADNCDDTLPDDPDWTRDQIAVNAYGLNYNQLNASQKTLVDNTWGNLMSYHDPDNRSILTACQMDRQSAQGYADRTWLLTQIPTYVRVGAATVPFVDMGSWAFPYPTIQDAINAGEVNNRAVILLNGTHANPASVMTTDTDLIPRRGTAHIQDLKPAYDLPYNLEDSRNPAVRGAVIRAQQFDRLGDGTNALAALREAARQATGRERDALHLEIAQRLSADQRFSEAETYFTQLASESDQAGLRTKAQRKAQVMQAKQKSRGVRAQEAPQNKPSDNPDTNDQKK